MIVAGWISVKKAVEKLIYRLGAEDVKKNVRFSPASITEWNLQQVTSGFTTSNEQQVNLQRVTNKFFKKKQEILQRVTSNEWIYNQ